MLVDEHNATTRFFDDRVVLFLDLFDNRPHPDQVEHRISGIFSAFGERRLPLPLRLEKTC